MSLRDKLNAANNISDEAPQQQHHNSGIKRVSQSQFLSGNLDTLTEQIFGNDLIATEEGQKPYDPKEEMKMLKNGLPKDLSKSKLPDAIKESIANNPLMITSEDPKMDAFTAKLAKARGIQKTSDIMNKLAEDDREKEAKRKELNEVVTHESIDYSLIKTIVENSVKSLKKEIKEEIAESVNHVNISQEPNLKVMKMGSKFLFLDDQNNIYECQLIYRGKNKGHKKN